MPETPSVSSHPAETAFIDKAAPNPEYHGLPHRTPDETRHTLASFSSRSEEKPIENSTVPINENTLNVAGREVPLPSNVELQTETACDQVDTVSGDGEASIPCQSATVPALAPVHPDEFYSVNEQQFAEMMNQLESLASNTISSETAESRAESNGNQIGEIPNPHVSTTLSHSESASNELDAASILSNHGTTPAVMISARSTDEESPAELIRPDEVKQNDTATLSIEEDETSAVNDRSRNSPEAEHPNPQATGLPVPPPASQVPLVSLVPPVAIEFRTTRPKLVQVLDVSKTSPASPVLPNAAKSKAAPATTILSAPGQNRSPVLPRLGHLLGIDHTTTRTGFAICNSDQTIVSLIESGKQHEPVDARRMLGLVSEHNIVGLVVSVPVSQGGEEHPRTVECHKFATWLEEITQLPTAFAEARSSSRFAAQVMLQAYLDGRRAEKAKSPQTSRMMTEC